MPLIRDKDHRAGHLPSATVFQDMFPCQGSEIPQDQMKAGSQENGRPTVRRASLHREHVERHDEEDEQGLLESFDKLFIVPTFQYVVKGVEGDRDQDVCDEQQQRKGSIGLCAVGIAPAMTNDVCDNEGKLKNDGIDENEIDMFQPSLAVALVHNFIWFRVQSLEFKSGARKEERYQALLVPSSFPYLEIRSKPRLTSVVRLKMFISRMATPWRRFTFLMKPSCP